MKVKKIKHYSFNNQFNPKLTIIRDCSNSHNQSLTKQNNPKRKHQNVFDIFNKNNLNRQQAAKLKLQQLKQNIFNLQKKNQQIKHQIRKENKLWNFIQHRLQNLKINETQNLKQLSISTINQINSIVKFQKQEKLLIQKQKIYKQLMDHKLKEQILQHIQDEIVSKLKTLWFNIFKDHFELKPYVINLKNVIIKNNFLMEKLKNKISQLQVKKNNILKQLSKIQKQINLKKDRFIETEKIQNFTIKVNQKCQKIQVLKILQLNHQQFNDIPQKCNEMQIKIQNLMDQKANIKILLLRQIKDIQQSRIKNIDSNKKIKNKLKSDFQFFLF